MTTRTHCNACPRQCESASFCGAPVEIVLARTGLHFGEEPCISGTRGSGTIFFCGCNLRCAFCQNAEISQQKADGYFTCDPHGLAEIFRKLEDAGAHNINLVTPSHYTAAILSAFKEYRPRIPVVYNTSSYDLPQTIERLAEYVDIWLPDLKFYDAELSQRLTMTSDYFEAASQAIKRMRRLQPKDLYNSDGTMTAGVLARHLVLPSHVDDTEKVLTFFASLPVRVSLMSQYVPCHLAAHHPDINRKLTTYEYNKALAIADRLGLDGYRQQRSSATTTYIPAWNEYL